MEDNVQIAELFDELPLRENSQVNDMSRLVKEIETRIYRRSLGRKNILGVGDRVVDNVCYRWIQTHSNGYGKRRLVSLHDHWRVVSSKLVIHLGPPPQEQRTSNEAREIPQRVANGQGCRRNRCRKTLIYVIMALVPNLGGTFELFLASKYASSNKLNPRNV